MRQLGLGCVVIIVLAVCIMVGEVLAAWIADIVRYGILMCRALVVSSSRGSHQGHFSLLLYDNDIEFLLKSPQVGITSFIIVIVVWGLPKT